MPTNPKHRQLSRRPSTVGALSRATGLLMSVGLVAVMTIWATSSPFSPLSQQSDVETVSEPFSMLQKVKEAFAVSDSILPSPTVEPLEDQLQPQVPIDLAEETNDISDQTDAAELTRQERKHTLQEEDRTAWLSFPRQESLLLTKPVARAVKLPLKEDLVMEAAQLPEVHFASAEPQLVESQVEEVELEAITPSPPMLLSLSQDESSEQVEEPALVVDNEQPQRIAKLPELPQIVPVENKIPINGVPINGILQSTPVLPQKNSWEIGRY